MGAILFVFYFLYYRNVDELQKSMLSSGVDGDGLYPLLISMIVGLNIMQEERASHFQNLMMVPERKKTLLAKFAALYLSGISSLVLLFTLFMIGVGMSQIEIIPWRLLMQSVLGLAMNSFVIYALHLFFSLKFGLGPSVFWGVFECLQCILYSNIELHGLWRYIPFSWSVNWVHDVLNGRLVSNTVQWILIAVLSVGFLLIILSWFSRWEGRKKFMNKMMKVFCAMLLMGCLCSLFSGCSFVKEQIKEYADDKEPMCFEFMAM